MPLSVEPLAAPPRLTAVPVLAALERVIPQALIQAVVDRHLFRTYAQARTAIFDYIEGFYNTHRRHSALGYLCPAAFERQLSKGIAA